MIQEEVTTDRPVVEDVGEAPSMSLGLQGFLRRWEDYNEQERNLLTTYEAGFSNALQAQAENIKGQSDKISQALQRYWEKYEEEKKNRRRYEEKKRSYGRGARKYKRRYRGAAEEKGKALNIAEAERAKLYEQYEQLGWEPPEMAETPGVPGLAPREKPTSEPQAEAVAGRTARSEFAVGHTPSEAQEFHRQQLGLVEREKGFRGSMAEKYGGLATSQHQRFLGLQESIDPAIQKAIEKEDYLHERYH